MLTQPSDGEKAIALSTLLLLTARRLEPDLAILTAAFVDALGTLTAGLTAVAPNGDGKITPLAKTVETLTLAHDTSLELLREKVA